MANSNYLGIYLIYQSNYSIQTLNFMFVSILITVDFINSSTTIIFPTRSFIDGTNILRIAKFHNFIVHKVDKTAPGSSYRTFMKVYPIIKRAGTVFILVYYLLHNFTALVAMENVLLSFVQSRSVEELLSAEKQNVALLQQANNEVNVSERYDRYTGVTAC